MNRYRLFIYAFALTALTLVLLVTASPTPDAQAAPRSIPWDCSDWQETPAVADAADARVSMILESLAANRGKSIYCAIDQSDTWTKSETWLAGRDRNERDDTVYFGEQGNFRGFLAAQEGYLTDGESGVTGVSRDLIFEFPREERRGKKTVRFRVGSGAADTDTCITPHSQTLSERTPAPPGGLICSNLHGAWTQSWVQSWDNVQHRSRNLYVGRAQGINDWSFDWRTRARTRGTSNPTVAGASSLSEDEWIAKAEAAAIPACRARGGKYVAGSADFGPGHNRESGEGSLNNVDYMGPNHGWFYDYRRNSESGGSNANAYQAKARESRTWSAVCKKRVRRR